MSDIAHDTQCFADAEAAIQGALDALNAARCTYHIGHMLGDALVALQEAQGAAEELSIAYEDATT